jgi:hypothetical protein
MVGQYIGETANKVKNILKANQENVMFIDEAYAIAQGSPGSAQLFDPYGVEAINEIVGFLDKNRGQIAMVVAGYKCEMDAYFFDVNVGMRRRFKYHWELLPFTPIELLRILSANTNKAGKPLNEILTRGALQLLFKFMNFKTTDEMLQEGSEFMNTVSDLNDFGKNPKLIPEKDAASTILGQYLFRRLFANEAGDMDILSDALIQYYEGGLESNKQIDEVDLVTIIVDILYDRDGTTTARSEIQWNEEEKRCMEKVFCKIFFNKKEAKKFVAKVLFRWDDVTDDQLISACLTAPCEKLTQEQMEDDEKQQRLEIERMTLARQRRMKEQEMEEKMRDEEAKKKEEAEAERLEIIKQRAINPQTDDDKAAIKNLYTKFLYEKYLGKTDPESLTQEQQENLDRLNAATEQNQFEDDVLKLAIERRIYLLKMDSEKEIEKNLGVKFEPQEGSEEQIPELPEPSKQDRLDLVPPPPVAVEASKLKKRKTLVEEPKTKLDVFSKSIADLSERLTKQQIESTPLAAAAAGVVAAPQRDFSAMQPQELRELAKVGDYTGWSKENMTTFFSALSKVVPGRTETEKQKTKYYKDAKTALQKMK